MRLSLETEIAVLMGLSPFNMLTLLPLIVDGLMDFEKVRTTCAFMPTLVVPFDGVIVTVGAVVSAVLVVVKEPAPL